MTQEELAKSAYVSKQVISNIERGVTGSVNEYVMNLLSFALMVRTEYLTGESDDPVIKDGLRKVAYRLPKWEFEPDIRQVLQKYSRTREVEHLLRDIVYYLSQVEEEQFPGMDDGVKLLQFIVEILRDDRFEDLALLVSVVKAFKEKATKN